MTAATFSTRLQSSLPVVLMKLGGKLDFSTQYYFCFLLLEESSTSLEGKDAYWLILLLITILTFLIGHSSKCIAINNT